MAEFRMPSLGADMTAGTLIGWFKKPGDAVKRGDIIAEVDTDKGVIEVEVFEDGTIESLLVKKGEKVPVGTALAMIAGPTKERPTIVETAPSSESPRIHVSPVARKLAGELGVNLSRVVGTGPNGRIQRDDVEHAARSVSEEPPESGPTKASDSERYDRMRKAIAAAMARSKREIPHYYLGTTIDLSRALQWLDIENAKRSIKDRILYSVLLIKAVALALRETPELNATWENDQRN